MKYCPNCVEELVKVRHKKGMFSHTRLKCKSCGFETSEKEERQRTEEFLQRIKDNNINKYYIQDENYEWVSNNSID